MVGRLYRVTVPAMPNKMDVPIACSGGEINSLASGAGGPSMALDLTHETVSPTRSRATANHS